MARIRGIHVMAEEHAVNGTQAKQRADVPRTSGVCLEASPNNRSPRRTDVSGLDKITAIRARVKNITPVFAPRPSRHGRRSAERPAKPRRRNNHVLAPCSGRSFHRRSSSPSARLPCSYATRRYGARIVASQARRRQEKAAAGETVCARCGINGVCHPSR